MSLRLSFLSGVSTHILLFRRGEWDTDSHRILLVYTSLITTSILIDLLKHLLLNHQESAAEITHLSPFQMITLHIIGVWTSMVTYRLFFHRLHHFPGPLWAKVSNFYMLTLNLCRPRFQFHERLRKLHGRYGDFVRVGPNQLFVSEPQAVRAVHSVSAKTVKGPGYAVLEPRISLAAIRDVGGYGERRRVWDKAFQPGALRNYEPRVQKYTDQLLDVFRRHRDSPLEMTQWFNFFAFDVMGDLSFGKSFNMLVDGREAYLLKTLREDRTAVGLLGFVPWTFTIFQNSPGINAEYLKMWEWVSEQVREREKHEPALPDIFSWILRDFEERNSDEASDHRQLRFNFDGDAYLLVIAGSETTAITLTSVFFHLAHDPLVASTLRNELLAIEEITFETLKHCRYLNAVINETMRLHPVVLSGLQRKTPREGLVIGSTFVPGDVLVQVPQFVVCRDKRCFVRASEFIPERWTNRTDLVLDSSSFIPFSMGTHSCVGKQLALMELRWVIARVLLQFSVKLADHQNSESFLSGTQDFFTALPSSLELVFSERGQS